MHVSLTSNYMRLKLIYLQGEIDESTIEVGDFNTFLSEIDLVGSKSVRTQLNSTLINDAISIYTPHLCKNSRMHILLKLA